MDTDSDTAVISVLILFEGIGDERTTDDAQAHLSAQAAKVPTHAIAA